MIWPFNSKSEINNNITKSYRALITELGDNITRKEQLKTKEAFRILLQLAETNPGSNIPQIIQKSIDKAFIAVHELYLGYSSLISILLYDSYKSGLIDIKNLQSSFNVSIIQILDDLKRIDKIDTTQIKNQSENILKLLLTSVSDVRAILIKLVERIYVLRNLIDLSASEKLAIANEVYYLYVQIANRLGFYSLKNELEDASFKIIQPTEYRAIDIKLHSTISERNKFIDALLKPIHSSLSELNTAYEIKWRTKSVHSIWMKMQKQNVDFEQIYDVFAIRILLKSKPKDEQADCWQAYSRVTNIYKPNPSRLRDWISVPKESGYESLHITVQGPDNKWVEIQIRTERMDEQAEKGLAAHWKYKGGKTLSWFDNWLKTIRDLFDDPNTQLRDLNQSSKGKLDEIFVFTPNGDLIKLKNGSTALDMAFSLHTELGASCTGAKINGKIVSLKEVLNNGDKVELLTNKKQKPKRDWLKFVITSKARNKIKRLLIEEENLEAEQGKTILKRKFRNWKIPLNDTTISFIINHYKFNNALELYSKISQNTLDPIKLKELIKSQKENEKRLNEPMNVLKAGKEIDNKELKNIIEVEDNSIKGINFTYAKCCSPITGDAIVGFITIHRGITIHKQKCTNAAQMLKNYGYRQVDVKWAGQHEKLSFEVSIKITGTDEVGIINSITDLISKELKVNIKSFNINTVKRNFEGIINLNIENTDQLTALLNKLKKIKGVNKAIRINQTD